MKAVIFPNDSLLLGRTWTEVERAWREDPWNAAEDDLPSRPAAFRAEIAQRAGILADVRVWAVEKGIEQELTVPDVTQPALEEDRRSEAFFEALDAAGFLRIVRDMPVEYRPHPRAVERRASAVRLAELVVGAEGIAPEHRRQFLDRAIWAMTQAGAIGKYGLRYRTRAALTVRDRGSLIHEHVLRRKTLVDRMLAEPSRVAEIMGTAIGCVVTREEDAQLSAVDQRLEGWDRYQAAGIEEVFDLRGTHFSSEDPSPYEQLVALTAGLVEALPERNVLGPDYETASGG